MNNYNESELKNETIQGLQQQIEHLTQIVSLLRKEKFGSSSEKTPKPTENVASLFNEVEEIFYLSEARLTNILFNQIYEAEFEAKHMVSQSEQKTEDNRSIILAIGAFDKNTTITITDMLATESIINEVELTENWQVSISNIGVEKLHYRIPADMQANKIQLFVKDASGTWTEREYMVEGSYIIFDFAESEAGFALAESSGNELYLGVAVVAVILLIVVVLILRKRKSSKKGKYN